MKQMFLLVGMLSACLMFPQVLEGQRVNVALRKTAQQSSDMNYNSYTWRADFALDGNADFEVNCRCCSCTLGRETPWLMIDLTKIYQIGRIDVVGRPDIPYQLRGFKVYTGETERQAHAMTNLVYTDRSTITGYNDAYGQFVIPVGNISIKFIRIYNENIPQNVMSICEVYVYEACEDYQFEPDCRPCYCEGTPCDKITGACLSNCQLGWQGASCNMSCDTGKFGRNCADDCHCQNQSTCNKATGECSDGQCIFGWHGQYCNISSVISEGKNVQMSSQYKDMNAERAVDGDIRTSSKGCQCCAHTEETLSAWFEVDLGKLFRVEYIILYGRDDYKYWIQSFRGLEIYAQQHNKISEKPIFSNPEKVYFLNITLADPVVTQYITLKQSNTRERIIVICELQLLEGDCDDGEFGRLCDKSCHCHGDVCDKETGMCPSGLCLPGYKGIKCSEVCAGGRFGSNCSETCGHCSNNTACDNVLGNCTSCDPGYFGQLCIKQCEYGTYGVDCSQSCGSCASNITCNNTNGHCGDAGCTAGLKAPLCLTRTEDLAADVSLPLSSGAAVAIIVAISVIALAVLVLVFAIRRKRRQTNKNDKETEVVVDGNARDQPKEDKPTLPDKGNDLGQKLVRFTEEMQEVVEYYDFAPRKEDIKIHQIWDYIHDGMANDCKQFYREFESLKKGLQFECKCATEAKNKSKNRYKEIYAYDDNRVRLTPTVTAEGDYINASFINGYEKVAKFIASQGPTNEMVEDFWQMIWQQHCTVIIMLTNISELGVQKCLQYWPMDDEPLSFGNMLIKVLEEEKFTDFVIRNLELSYNNDEPRIIKQYHFTAWPDKTTPDTAWSLVNFWRTVRDNSTTVTAPIVVHCSAGIGRTGTFIALDNLYNQAVNEGCIRPAQMVETLRRQRVNMVQTNGQYVYMHEAVAEALLFGTHSVKTEQFEHMYGYLLKQQEGKAKTNLEIQFDIIELSLQGRISGVNTENSESGKEGEIRQTEELTETEAVYTNVSETTQSEDIRKGQTVFIVDGQSLNTKEIPIDLEKGEALLNLIVASKVRSIIKLQEDATGLTPNSQCDQFTIQSSNQTKSENWTREEFTILDAKGGNDINWKVKQYEYYDWKKGGNTPSNLISFLSLLSDVKSTQHEDSDGESTLVADSCSKRCGVLCVLLIELTRMSKEDRVNIVESVKKIRHLDKGLLSTLEQHKFCYEALLSTIQQNDLYQNVFL